MKHLPKDTQALLAELQAIETFQDIDPAALEWMIGRSDYLEYAEGEMVFQIGQEANHMLIFLSGEVVGRIKRGGKVREISGFKVGTITGILPFSRMKENGADGIVYAPTRILQLHKNCFTEMVNVSYELTQALVAVMSTRIRDFSQLRFQDEKLMALGKLSAGLAHELNNPAAAMVRSSEALYEQVHATPEKFKAVIKIKITEEQTDNVNEILFSKIRNASTEKLSLMEREEAIDDMLDWLEDQSIEDADEMAETFVDYQMSIEDCEAIVDIMNGDGVNQVLDWVQRTLNLEKLVEEIKESADRISTLIKAIKGYSHMDRASTIGPTNLHEGLYSTLMMLKHEIKVKRIKVDKQLGENIPTIQANPGELNQVWTNLIVNAVQAMGEDGTLTIHSYVERTNVCVEITDNGSGIPEDIQTRVFEPFFTTKAMDEGTGMGLDIVKKIIDRHKAEITLESVPGKTTFKVCFPIVSELAHTTAAS